MRLALSFLALLAAVSAAAPQNSLTTQWPLHDDGLNEIVQWDHYSFLVNGKRIFIFAGEMHYWRIPVPDMWEDILQKIKAAGCNAFTFYGHWGYHAPNQNTVDFTNGAHDFTRLFELAHEIGLYVFVRPGPYINAEANAGGFPLWLTTGDYGSLRNNDSRYTAAWQPYASEFAKITSKYQITSGQNALAYQMENEYGQQWIGNPAKKVPNDTAIDYMELLEASARSNGINIPLTHNNPNMNSKSWSKDFSNAGGNVDVYGLDSYPACWSCNLAECTSINGPYIAFGVQEYYDHFQLVAPTQPEFMPEFQGGSYNPWGGPKGGCLENTNEDFANLYYRHNVAERVTAMSLYMLYGGTSWGWFAAPVVATSYDYSAPISESRSIGAKYYETKILALFLRVAEDLRVADRIGNSTNYTNNTAILTTELRNPDTNAGFYVTIHQNSSVDTAESFKIGVNTSMGALTIPQKVGSILLNGHQSKIIVTDFTFGARTLTYSTAEVLTYAILDGVPTLVLWLPSGESGEFHLKYGKKGSLLLCRGCSGTDFHPDSTGLLVTFTQKQGMTVMQIDDVRVIIVDRISAYKLWAPALSADPFAPVNETVLVQGPYLVRSATYQNADQIVELTGDSDNATHIEVFAAKSIETISWNGKYLTTTKTSYGSLQAQIPGPDTKTILLPSLNSWKVHDSLPERFASYNDSGPAWVDADHMSTMSPYPPATLPVLYVDEYGFHNGVHLWRGYFTGPATAVFLNVQGGTAFDWSAWLNGEFIGSFLGSSNLEAGNLTLSFSNATVKSGENVLLVIQDNSGHDETTGALNPRGIINATLLGGGKFSSWKVAGTAGGDSNPIDPMRGALAEGGLSGERLGWHLPGYDDSSWNTSLPSTGFSGAGVKFYRTVVPLSIPAGRDVSIAFVLSSPGSQKLRAQLFVNGYQYGRFNPWIGNQVEFPVPPGILDYSGENTIALAVWSQSEEGGQIGVEWKIEYVTETSYDFLFDGSYLRPSWDKRRLAYA